MIIITCDKCSFGMKEHRDASDKGIEVSDCRVSMEELSPWQVERDFDSRQC